MKESKILEAELRDAKLNPELTEDWKKRIIGADVKATAAASQVAEMKRVKTVLENEKARREIISGELKQLLILRRLLRFQT